METVILRSLVPQFQPFLFQIWPFLLKKIRFLAILLKTANQNFMFISPVAYSYQSVEKRFYEKVRRENNMVKGVKGAAAKMYAAQG